MPESLEYVLPIGFLEQIIGSAACVFLKLTELLLRSLVVVFRFIY